MFESTNLALDFQRDLALDLDGQFIKVSQKISMLLACEGVKVKAFRQGLPIFSKLPVLKKMQAVRDAEFFKELCQEQVSDGYKIKDNLSFTWRALNRLGLVPRSDLFNHLRDDHVVEVYSAENVQLFRNLNFFEFCSYTLEDLYSMEWWHLYQRDQDITRELFDYATSIFAGEIKNNFIPDLRNHKVNEVSSVDKLEMEYGIDLVGPLYVSKEPRAVIVFESAKLVT